MNMNKLPEAINVFKANGDLNPNSSNAFDILTEAYLEAGYKELAIANYMKSMELNPDNKETIGMLKQLETTKYGNIRLFIFRYYLIYEMQTRESGE